MIISRRVETSKPIKVQRSISLKDFYNKRNKILILRRVGGLGDILMHRMLFEDIKILMPDAETHFACPECYHDAIKDHPFIDHIHNSLHFDKSNFLISYDTSTACGRYENKIAPLSDLHRSDIWANHCGFKLTKHNMHIKMEDYENKRGKELIEEIRDRQGPSVAVAPVSAMESKNLRKNQLIDTIKGLRDRGFYVFTLHKNPISYLTDVPYMHNLSVRAWMSVIHEVDYVISVDTAAVHCAGGMGKPTVGIFTWADGLVYTMYYPTCIIVQKHRSYDKDWTCGPCYNWCACPKTKEPLKPCLTELSGEMILNKFDLLVKNFPR